MDEIKVCHTDAYTLSGQDGEAVWPVILGHEGGGIVESVGEGVTSVKPGDHVLPLYIPQCKECEYCHHPDTNLCQKVRVTQGRGVMPDGTTRFRCKGQQVFHYMGTSTFSEYTVCLEISVAKVGNHFITLLRVLKDRESACDDILFYFKVNDAAPLEKICLLGWLVFLLFIFFSN